MGGQGQKEPKRTGTKTRYSTSVIKILGGGMPAWSLWGAMCRAPREWVRGAEWCYRARRYLDIPVQPCTRCGLARQQRLAPWVGEYLRRYFGAQTRAQRMLKKIIMKPRYGVGGAGQQFARPPKVGGFRGVLRSCGLIAPTQGKVRESISAPAHSDSSLFPRPPISVVLFPPHPVISFGHS